MVEHVEAVCNACFSSFTVRQQKKTRDGVLVCKRPFVHMLNVFILKTRTNRSDLQKAGKFRI